jgi:regulator of sirC expression with transglutaminase-like and TPR domain
MEKGFARLACGGCPPLADLLLAMAAEFRAVDFAAADAALDELALPMFGAQARDAAETLAATLERFGADRCSVAGLWLDCVLEARAGHPLMLAAIAAEAGRRAGISVHVFSSPGGWYAGLTDGERAWLVDATLAGRAAEAAQLRRHCAHELAFAALLGLSERWERAGEAQLAGRAALLRSRLPLG